MFTMKRLFIMLLILSLGLVAMGCNNGEEVPSVEEVNLSEVVRVVEAFGVVKTETSKDIILDFPATVEEVLVREGQHVEKGTPIFLLDRSAYVAEIRNKENELSIAQLEYQRIEKSLDGLYLEDRFLEIDKLSNDLSFAMELYASSLQDVEDYKKLYEAGAIPQQELTTVKRRVDDKKNEVARIEYALQQLHAKKDQELQHFRLQQGLENDQLKIHHERIQQIKSSLAAMKAKLDRPYLEENKVISDFEKAVIYDVHYTAGSIVTPSQKAFSLLDLESLIIEADVVEEFIRDVAVGASVRIVPVSDRTRDYEGEVVSISTMAFPKNGETVVPITISIKDVDDFLIPNYNVDVFIEIQEH